MATKTLLAQVRPGGGPREPATPGGVQTAALVYHRCVMELLHRHLFLSGAAGPLEALYWAVEYPAGAAPSLAAVICHPNPLFGGTMHNKVVYQAAKTLSRLRIPVLRFNFRGVGLSEGKHDKGRGEQRDVTAAVDFIVGQYPGAPILLAGFSFGAAVGLRAGCADARVTELIGLGLPVTEVGSERLAYLRECKKPKLLLSGAEDVYSPRESMVLLAEKLPAEVQRLTRLQFVPHADHFFAGHLAELDQAISDWLVECHPDLAAKES